MQFKLYQNQKARDQAIVHNDQKVTVTEFMNRTKEPMNDITITNNKGVKLVKKVQKLKNAW